MKLLRLSLICLCGSAILASCVKQNFTAPPNTSEYDPQLPVNSTLKDFAFSGLGLQMGQSRVLGDSTISGIVIGDDRSGNIYKKIIIEDSAGFGMTVILDKTYLYGDYPVGRRIYIKTKGLALTNYKGVPEIVYSINPDNTTNGIPSSLINTFIIKGSYPHTIKPVSISILDLYANPYQYINTLVTLENMQFDNASAGVPYSAATSSTNRTVTNCDMSAKIIMYNSSYSSFQSALTPTGNGSITGIVSVYISTPQFIMRDTADVVFTTPRCP